MKFTITLLISILMISTVKADSVTLSTDSVSYEGYELSGQSFSFNNDKGRYGYELSLQRFNSYLINEQRGHLNIQNEIDLTNISLGLYRQLNYNKFYIRPIAGVVHSTVNVKTTLRYYNRFKLIDDHVINLKYEQYSSKTALLPMYGIRVGYNFNKHFDVYIGYRHQGYPVKLIGGKINF